MIKIELDTAIALWQLLFDSSSATTTYPYLSDWVQFLCTRKTGGGSAVTKDTWNLVRFLKVINIY